MLHKCGVAKQHSGVLRRLHSDKRGNSMLLMVAGLIPLIGVMGGAVDFSRVYLVKHRLQQACDAGVLAGRRSMVGNVVTEADKNEAYRLFAYNFPNGTMGSEALTQNTTSGSYVNVTRTNSGQMGMAAATTVPTTLLRIIGKQTLPVTVKCTGEEYYVNTDVMLVLDTTGSMNCTISDPSTCSAVNERANSKMEDLRESVKDLYANLRPAQEELERKRLRMRFGFVMYSSNVNVGKLIYAENSEYINNPASVYRNSSGNLVNDGTKSASWFTGTGSSNWNGCITERQTSSSIDENTTAIPASAFDLDIATIPNSTATRWSPHIPSAYRRNNLGWNSYDNSNATTQGYNTCPQPARHLESWASIDAFDNYVDSTIVTGRGGTYHDIGMIWGTRMIANNGIFGSRNPDMFNNVKVRRTIVLVTDGTMSPNSSIYGAYGVERYDQRVYSGASNPDNAATYRQIHENRFNLMCTRARSMNIDIWVVAILDNSTDITDSLRNCATTGQAIKVSDTTALTAAFNRIADKVGNLRVGQ